MINTIKKEISVNYGENPQETQSLIGFRRIVWVKATDFVSSLFQKSKRLRPLRFSFQGILLQKYKGIAKQNNWYHYPYPIRNHQIDPQIKWIRSIQRRTAWSALSQWSFHTFFENTCQPLRGKSHPASVQFTSAQNDVPIVERKVIFFQLKVNIRQMRIQFK